MPSEPNWLSPREDRAWRAFMHAHHRLGVRLNQLQLQDSGLTKADYELLAVLSGYPDGRVPAQEACALLQWEKSRLSHQVRHLQEQGLVTRAPNPADGRSSVIVLLPAGRRAIEDAAPQHVENVRRLFIDLFSPAELDMLAALHERVLSNLAEETGPEQPAPEEIVDRLAGPAAAHEHSACLRNYRGVGAVGPLLPTPVLALGRGRLGRRRTALPGGSHHGSFGKSKRIIPNGPMMARLRQLTRRPVFTRTG